MKTKALLFLAAMAVGTLSFAQVSIPSLGTPVTVDFTGFDGSGFDPAPLAGQLDSDDWAVTGLSDGDLAFGGTNTTGDYAKGVTTGGIFSGGIYSFDDGSNQLIWVQATSSDFSPGTLTLRLQNNTGGTISELDVDYDLHVLNNEDRANSWNFSYSQDDASYIATALNYTSVEVEDTLGIIEIIPFSTTITGLSVADGGFVYLRWESDDVSGGGSRDEFGLDNITVSAPATLTAAINFNSTAVSANEGDGSVDVTVDLAADADCDIDVVVVGGSATDPSDYSYSTTTLSFVSGGSLSQNVSISLVDDSDLEMNETIDLELQNVTGTCIIGAANAATVTVSDNDNAPLGECLNLYFSEYLEGSSNNKALEIYNPTGMDVDLSAYTVSAFNNGGITPTNTENLSGILAAGDVYVIANASADSAILAVSDITSTVTFINGDDAVVLFNGADTIDIIGRVGEDPGSSWPVDTGATNEHTLVRKAAVKNGQLDWNLGDDEWDVYAQDDFSFLGSHIQDACPAVGCSDLVTPENPRHTDNPSNVLLEWDAVTGSVGCRVSGSRISPPGPSGSATLLTPEVFQLTILYASVADATDTTTWEWSVTCACSISPLVLTMTSATDQFMVPPAGPRVGSEVSAEVYPNPASDIAVFSRCQYDQPGCSGLRKWSVLPLAGWC
jgi:hypothetical protein